MRSATGTRELGQLPPPGTGLSRQRRGAGFALALLGLPPLTALLAAGGSALPLDSVFLLYLLGVVVVAVVGGILPALFAAVGSFLLVNWFFTAPFGTLAVESTGRVIDLVVFPLVALTVSVTVDAGARRRVAGARAQIEAHTLAQLSSTPMALTGPDLVVGHVRALFDLDAVHLVQNQVRARADDAGPVDTAVIVASAGTPPAGPATVAAPAGADLQLLAWGRDLAADDVRALRGFAQVAGRSEEGRRLADEAARGRELAAVDRLRSALLAAVGHDLRTPLAAAKAATSSLLSASVDLSVVDQRELVVTVDEAINRLTDLIANLLDLSRLQAGALQPQLRPVGFDEVVARALLVHRGDLSVAVRDDLPMVTADPGLLERVVANLVDNAVRHSLAGQPVQIRAAVTVSDPPGGWGDNCPVGPATVALQVIDHGPGVPQHKRKHLFVPFQRLDDARRCAQGRRRSRDREPADRDGDGARLGGAAGHPLRRAGAAGAMARRLSRSVGVQQRRLRSLQRQPHAVRDRPLGEPPRRCRWILGGIGFPVLFELRRNLRRPSHWTVHTKITLMGTAVLLLGGTAFMLAAEWNNPGTLGPFSVPGKLLAGFFQGVMPRTAGFNSVDVAQMNSGTWLGTDVLMFIGGGSAGTAGGIKVTTFTVLLFVIFAEVRGDDDTRAYGRRIPAGAQRQALSIALLGVAAIVVPAIAFTMTTSLGLDEILYEIVSAFATVGLSTGITAALPAPHQLVLVALMFIGRTGTITLGTALALRHRDRLYRFPEERPLIG